MFPLKGPQRGVGSVAVESGQLQIRNSMESELKERGEARLRAMMSVPVPWGQRESIENGAIVAVNIYSVIEDAFPHPDSSELEPVQKRARDLSACVEQVNRLWKAVVQRAK